MIQHPSFRVEPWALHETELDLGLLAQSESLFALSNGHIGLRGNLDEGEPHGLPGSYLNGLYELRPVPYAEARSVPALRDQVAAALEAARTTGWDGLLAQQRRYLDDFWSRADVELSGDPELQQAVRFALFHVLQAGARAERRAIPAKGLTGTGYDGHSFSFWDTEAFITSGTSSTTCATGCTSPRSPAPGSLS